MATPQDWRVTAYLEAQSAIAAFNHANDEPRAPLDEPVQTAAQILRGYWDAAQAASAAAGAMVEAELHNSMSWAEVAQALGFDSVDTAQQALTPGLALAHERLAARIPGDPD